MNIVENSGTVQSVVETRVQMIRWFAFLSGQREMALLRVPLLLLHFGMQSLAGRLSIETNASFHGESVSYT